MVATPIVPSGLSLPRPPRNPSEFIPWAEAITRAIADGHRKHSLRLEDITDQGTLAQRPTATGARRFFWTTDTLALYFDDGTWRLIAGPGGGGSLTVEAADGTPTYPSITKLTFDEVDGFSITNPNGGEARIDFSGGGSNHNILSATHSDSLAASVVRGDIIRGNSTPAWSRLAKGTSGQVLTMVDANDPGWATPSAGGSIYWKDAVRVATTVNGTLATAYENGDTVDGVVLATGDRILLKNQTTGSENGLYTVNASGAPTRATDADVSAEVKAGIVVHVSEGTANADTFWFLSTNDPITLGTTSLTFTQFGAGGGMGDLKWEADAITTLASTALNSLAVGALVLTSEYDNSTALNLFGEFELVADFGTIPTEGTLVEGYLLMALDGTNFADGSTSIFNDQHYRFAFKVRAVTGVQRITASMHHLPPVKFKVQLRNATNQAFAASGNTLKLVPYHEQNV